MDLISRQAAIDTEGLDEQIRCEMCRNPMHTDRGCDGNCKYDEKLYERIIKILGERIKPLPSAQPKPLTDAEVVICKLYLEDLDKYKTCNEYKLLMGLLDGKAYVQPNIIHCNECEYGCQDKYGRWFCRSLGCQIGKEDGSGYCADAERRTDEPEK